MKEISSIFSRVYNKIMAIYQNSASSSCFPDMTVNEEYYLDILYCLGKPTFTQFAETAQITKPAATQIMKRYIEKGYVQKISCEKDRRVYYLEISDNVKQYFDESYRRFDKIYENCLSVLSKDEIKQLKSILTKIDNNL
ncbi:transcriptional regulator [Clostridium pasteurianum DSM 525 = ATCC 6013]|uniref:Transcriptional regulator n=1 Tax=Clostridium pasteurianum DSM 525 = ATCC 6013 TaxID=1262449 RepID=A0A0H3J4E0_CLOPA|nr:MarR family transcriptional regulator [Clostridium pasteurianum]AJA48806.1 transcriptional regulator [Clostridium pasteurianum DSM 525 = ATCC 6013]AJA52794.1 transcriptional regulator [Clostridium pasteurianum DSM 525 = ATCC 6013]AOZ76023.1 hypothetical protein AQ983_13300 [Clostridium pasteurianum DSM 525 = ATCC 6013]AOZ79819.1 hypothetical protein AQ984_13295 [Clostridium pasteurianum]ELP60102.1 transcriptional regulator [Clostridium pasteurianum DSM 525 = ATCC 6013]